MHQGTEFEPRDSWAARVIQQMWRRRRKEKRKVEFQNNARLQRSYRIQQKSYTGEEVVEPMEFDLLGNHRRGGSPGVEEQLANLIIEQMGTSKEEVNDEVEDLRAQLVGAHE